MSRSLRVYIASSFEQKSAVRRTYKLFIKQGHVITADWTVHTEIAALSNKHEQEDLRKQYSIEDAEGVRSAEVFVLLPGKRKSTGAHIELGIALGAKVPNIFIVSKQLDIQLFYHSAN